jgi:GNAT superfamily N-acetyltransferase
VANDGIKIELDHNPPLQSDYQELLASIMEEDKEAKLVQYEDFCQSFNVVAAYDQGRLVGLGRAAEQVRNSTNERLQCHITVLQQYRGRDIGSYMRKLLSVR